MTTKDDETVPSSLRIAAAWSWRIVIVAAAVALGIWLIITFRIVVIPVLIALLLAALLVPFSRWLQSKRWPKGLAIALAMVGALVLVGGLITLVVFQVRGEWRGLREATIARVDEWADWLAGPPFHLAVGEVDRWLAGLFGELDLSNGLIWSGVLSVGSTAGHILAGVLLTLFTLLFFLIDGGRIWHWLTRLFPRRARAAVDGAGRAGWRTLTRFAQVQIFVAFVDAVGIGLGAWIMGLFYGGFPLVIPIAVAVFLGSFIPIVGALVTGALAVFVALVYLGPWPAILMLIIVLVVQQLEGHVLQPLIMGTAVKVHPLAVVLAVASGSLIAGIAGALFAVPLVAALNVMVRYLAHRDWDAVGGADNSLLGGSPTDLTGAADGTQEETA